MSNNKNIELPPFEAVLMISGNESPSEVALKCLNEANDLLASFNSNHTSDTEHILRKALQKLIYCFWYYKDNRQYISQRMHAIGRYLCGNYNCKHKFDEEYYYTDCPNILLHNDFGFSMRGTEKYICSICGKDMIECEHITNNSYNNILCKSISGLCNICLEKD